MATLMNVLIIMYFLFSLFNLEIYTATSSSSSSSFSWRRELGNKPSKRRSPPPPSGNVWCVARPTEHSMDLARFKQSACKRNNTYGIDCRRTLPGRNCNFDGDFVMQTSFVLNLIFIKTHTCHFTYGYIVKLDPSTKKCHFTPGRI
ncbi:hypothetical protein ACJIZ3_015882 [Penstemon smallii]|uniref:X8 domain-containing protein n=1 Tax=Penstemon smallii TaxID=265156 RepID=A0ABD3RNS6_9LAMI